MHAYSLALLHAYVCDLFNGALNFAKLLGEEDTSGDGGVSLEFAEEISSPLCSVEAFTYACKNTQTRSVGCLSLLYGTDNTTRAEPTRL